MSIGAGEWLPPDFAHPVRVDLECGLHLRPIREDDVDLDLPAVRGSQGRLWAMFGEAWGWPPDSMSREEDRLDLARHEREIAAHESFNYALFDALETQLLGCVYIDPPEKAAADAEVCWWVVDGLVGSVAERELEALVPHWLHDAWPFRQPRLIGVDLSWREWMDLPDLA